LKRKSASIGRKTYLVGEARAPLIIFFKYNKLAALLIQQKRLKKTALNALDKIFFYYMFNQNFSMFTYKIFTYMELLLFSVITSAQLIKYVYLIKILCFYRLVFINREVAINAFQSISIYDTVSVYNKINYYLYYQQFQQKFFATKLLKYFKIYWREFTTFQQSKI